MSDDGLTKEPNSYRFTDFCNSLLEQWSDDSLKERGRLKYDAKKSRSGTHGADSWEYDYDPQSGEYSEFAAGLQHSEENVAEAAAAWEAAQEESYYAALEAQAWAALVQEEATYGAAEPVSEAPEGENHQDPVHAEHGEGDWETENGTSEWAETAYGAAA